MTALLGKVFGADVARLVDENRRSPRYWGFTVGWCFVGFVTWPKASSDPAHPSSHGEQG